jgi:TrmH family RNA methyltransferase
VQAYYCNLVKYIEDYAKNIPVYGAFLEGADVHTMSFANAGILIMGNESQGIGPGLEPLVRQKVHIPRYGRAESLNVGIATAIICDNICRQWKN